MAITKIIQIPANSYEGERSIEMLLHEGDIKIGFDNKNNESEVIWISVEDFQAAIKELFGNNK